MDLKAKKEELINNSNAIQQKIVFMKKEVEELEANGYAIQGMLVLIDEQMTAEQEPEEKQEGDENGEKAP